MSICQVVQEVMIFLISWMDNWSEALASIDCRKEVRFALFFNEEDVGFIPSRMFSEDWFGSELTGNLFLWEKDSEKQEQQFHGSHDCKQKASEDEGTCEDEMNWAQTRLQTR